MAKTLVTSGNIGNYVAESLAAKGFPVRVLVRTVRPNHKWDSLGIEQAVGDLGNVRSLDRAFDGVDRFFSVTPMVENLVELGISAVEAAKRAGTHYIVRSSAMGASDRAITMGRWHYEVEKAIENSGITYTILQPNTFMQSYKMNADTIKSASTFYMPQGNGKVSLVDVRDIAEVVSTCMSEPGHEGKKYVITGAEALSNAEIAEKLTQALGRKISYIDVTPDQAKEAMAKSGIPAWMIQCLLELFAISKAGYVADASPVVRQLLKREPISFDQFLKDNLSAFRLNPEIGGVA